jgi:uncharacterized membrane protein YeaQ/YmgE (transglycosylase-associated protein family)
MTTETFAITLLVYLVAGAVPPMVAHYTMRTRFLGGIVAGALVGVIAAVGASLAVSVAPGVPDLVVVAGAVDIVWPLLGSVVLTALFAVVSAK